MSTPPAGFIFEIPEPLLRGGLYIPLAQHLPLPGCAALVVTHRSADARLFERLARRQEPFTVTLLREATPRDDGSLAMHQLGVLCIVSSHERLDDDHFQTLIAGVGRARLKTPYVLEGDELPRVDVEAVPTRCEDPVAMQRRLSQLIELFIASVGAAATELTAMLHRFAHESADVSVNIDRVAGVLAHGQPLLAQSFLELLALDARLDQVEHHLIGALHQLQRARQPVD